MKALSDIPFGAPKPEYQFPPLGAMGLWTFFSVVFWVLAVEAARFAINVVMG